MMLYSKVASIRERQKKIKESNEKELKEKNLKLFLLMELDRLKDLKTQEHKKYDRKDVIKKGADVLKQQIKDREVMRATEKQVIMVEREKMNKHLQEVDRLNDIKHKQRIEYEAKIGLEVLATNKIATQYKERRKKEEIEGDRKIFEYNQSLIKKEEEELREKLKLAELKEREVQMMRDKQEKAMDRNAELDAIRAKRAFEAAEREERRKEKLEAELKHIKMKELLEFNEYQKLEKEFKLSDEAKTAKIEFDGIIKKQIKDKDLEQKKENTKLIHRYEHNDELR